MWFEANIRIRFREIPPFGINGIRKITSNRSELKKLTAHDYEDMLLVCGKLSNFSQINAEFCSVLYRYLTVFWKNPTTPAF
jgi:hypothetical protein